MSRWHGIADSTTVGGDVHTVTAADTVTITVDTVAVTAVTAITTTRAANRFDISTDSASGT